MTSEEDIENLRKHFDKFMNVQKWQDKNVEKIVKIAQHYSTIFQADEVLHNFSPYLSEYAFLESPENAKNLPEYLLKYALHNLRSSKDRQLLALFIKWFVNIVPDGSHKAKTIISSYIRNFATEGIIFSAAGNKTFRPYIISSQMLNQQSESINFSEKNIACAAVIAIQQNDSLLPQFQQIIEKHFLQLPIDEIVKLALISDHTMKFVLSTTVPFILAGDPKAFEIIQKLASSSNPIPAQSAANELKTHQGINCLI